MNDNVRNFIKEVEANEELRAKIEALAGVDDAIEQAIAIAADCGYAITTEDIATLTEEDFQELEDGALGFDDLEAVVGGMDRKLLVKPEDWARVLPFIFKVKTH